MTEAELKDFTDAVALLVKGSDTDKDAARLARVVSRIEESAFQRGWQARQDRLIADLRKARDDLLA